MKSKYRFVTPILLLIIIFGFFIANYDVNKYIFTSAFKGEAKLDEKVKNAQTYHKEHFQKRNDLIDLYGIAQKYTGKRIIGNMEYVLDDNGVFQHIMPVTISDNFINSQIELNNTANRLGTPYVYLSLPGRPKDFPPVQSGELSAYGTFSENASKVLSKNGIDCLNLYEFMDSDEEAPSIDKFWLKTDGHTATYGEFWAAKRLALYLQNEYGVNFPDYDTVFDLNNYNVKTYDFVGNLGRMTNKYYSDIDDFEIYYPKFDTNLKYNNTIKKETRTGSFTKVMLNGYEYKTYSEYTYWITDFGHFTSPYYEYTNNLASDNAPNILVISDSIFMRGFTYLTLSCKHLTVADPRYFKGTEYIADALSENKYDAIVFVGQSGMTFRSSAKELDDYSSDIIKYEIKNGKLYVTVENNSKSSWDHWNQIKMGLFTNGADSGKRSYLPEDTTVKPGERYTFVFDNIDMNEILTNQTEAIMVHEGVRCFDEKCPITSEKEVFRTNAAEITSVSIPEQVVCGETYDFSVTVKNTGTSIWRSSSKHRLCIYLNGFDSGFRTNLPDNVTIMPDEEYTFTIKDYKIPEAGYNYLEFRMVQEGVEYFGEKERVDIAVDSSS